VAGAGPLDGGEELRVPVGGHEGAGLVQRPGFGAPRRFPPVELGGHVGHRVGREGAGDPGLLLAPSGVVLQQGAGDLDPGRGVSQVVGHHLVGLDRTGRGQVGEAPLDDVSGALDGRGGGRQVRGAHGATS
jgi:hypothetical protein